MGKYLLTYSLVICLGFSFFTSLQAQKYPNKEWNKAELAENLGWSSKKLKEVKEKVKSLGSDAFMIVTKGQVVLEYGNIAENFRAHSMRKSFLSALYGIYVDRGKINISRTLKELEIDDSPAPLSGFEKTAKISDLLKSRSGIYHLSASESASMKNKRPKRGSHEPGTFWYYNNWDMNVLGTIFEKEAEISIFVAFEKHISNQIGMQDFIKSKCTRYKHESESTHPSYKFKISARDLARFGLMYLYKGKWNDKQIISEKWIEKSTKSYSKAGSKGTKSGYGYMWWICTDEYLQIPIGTFTASGYGGQRLIIIPQIETIIVNFKKVTLLRNRIGTSKINELVQLIMRARIDSTQ